MSRRSVVQNNVKQRAVDLQATVFAPSVVDETHFPETVHEKADSRTGSANHLCQCFLTDLWDHTFRYAFFAKMGQHQKDARHRFSLELNNWSTKSSSYRMFRASRYATNMSERLCSR